MKTFNTSDRDSQIPKLAARDWERREAKATQLEAAETRQQAILQALELAPHFELHRLPQNFWVAVLHSRDVHPRAAEASAEEQGQKGCSSKTTAPSKAKPNGVGESYTFPSAITGCTDLYYITGQVLFFRSNLPEPELRENIDLSFLPF